MNIFGILKYFLTEYKNSKGEARFAYIRRWADDIKGFRSEQLFFPLQHVVEELFGKGYFDYILGQKPEYERKPSAEGVQIIKVKSLDQALRAMFG
mgnify:CR=1 FL=1